MSATRFLGLRVSPSGQAAQSPWESHGTRAKILKYSRDRYSQRTKGDRLLIPSENKDSQNAGFSKNSGRGERLTASLSYSFSIG